MKEKIRQAYLEYWEQLSEEAQEMALNNFGWIFHRDSIKRNGGLDECIEMEHHLIYTRPKSLQGIENNNGWYKIESEMDLPKEDCSCWIIDKFYGIVSGRWENAPTDKLQQLSKEYWFKNATH